MPSKKDIENSINNILTKKTQFKIKCRYQNLKELRNRLEDFTPDERNALLIDISRDIHFGKREPNLIRGNVTDYFNLCESQKITYSDLVRRIENNNLKPHNGELYNSSDYTNVDEYIKEYYPNISRFDDDLWLERHSNNVYTDKEYWDERFKYERSILESLSPNEIADNLAHNGDLYDTYNDALNRINELKLNPPDWLVANVNKVNIARVNAVVSGSSEVRNHASHTNGIRELHTEDSDGDGGLFTVIANSSNDVNRLADKVGATEVHHEEGDMYTISVPYSL